MGKYRDDAEKLLEYVGGKENIAAVTHCATRMRFVLNDQSKANEKAIEDIPSVKGMFTNAGQFQVIIGNDVPTFYNDFTAVSGIEGVSKEQVKRLQKNQNPFQRAIAVLAEILHQLYQLLLLEDLFWGSVMFWKELILVVEQLFPNLYFGVELMISYGYLGKQFSIFFQ